jgi:hypothetical protein
MEVKYINCKLLSKYKVITFNKLPFNTIISFKNSKKKDSNMYNNLLLNFKEKLKIYKKNLKHLKCQKEYYLFNYLGFIIIK